MPVGAASAEDCIGTISSVRAQLYPRWQLCLVVDSATKTTLLTQFNRLQEADKRLRILSLQGSGGWSDKANAALPIGSCDFVVPLDPGDELAERALHRAAKEILDFPPTDLLFSDEDTIGEMSVRKNPWFKSDFNPALMLACNAFGRLGVYRCEVVQRLGGFRKEFAGAEEHDLILRYMTMNGADRVRHIPEVLYHRREVSYSTADSPVQLCAWRAGARAIEDHLTRNETPGDVERNHQTYYQVNFTTAKKMPKVSIVMPSAVRLHLLKPCMDSLLELTTYSDFEILLVVNESRFSNAEQASYLNKLAQDSRTRVLSYPDRPYNFSAINNWAIQRAKGSMLCLLNDDVEIITKDWLERLVARLQLEQVGAVGAMLYYPNGTIQHAGVIIGLGGVAGHACLGEPRDAVGYFGRACLEQDVSCVTAACMAVRKEAFCEIGGLDEKLPLAYNDVDFCLRLRAAGWRIIWTPSVELTHHESASLGRHDEPPWAKQYWHDFGLVRQRWAGVLQHDPFYNRNLSLQAAYQLSFPPRTPLIEQQ
jgi:GT2 family glycosyltransferase